MIGTTPFFFKKDETLGPAAPLTRGNYYLAVRFHSGNVIRSGGFWDEVNGVAVTSEAAINNGGAVKSSGLHEAFDMKSEPSQTLSTNKDIIGLIPATVETINLTVKYVVSRHDRVPDVIALVRDNKLAALFSFATGTSQLIDGITSLVPTVLDLFKGGATTAQSDFLSANLTLDLTGDPLQPGVYVAFASHDAANHEVDNIAAEKITVGVSDVKVNGAPLQKTAYVALELRLHDTLDIDLHPDEEWIKQYNKAQELIQNFDTNAAPQEQATALQDIQKLIITVRTLLLDDRIFTNNDKIKARAQSRLRVSGLI